MAQFTKARGLQLEGTSGAAVAAALETSLESIGTKARDACEERISKKHETAVRRAQNAGREEPKKPRSHIIGDDVLATITDDEVRDEIEEDVKSLLADVKEHKHRKALSKLTATVQPVRVREIVSRKIGSFTLGSNAVYAATCFANFVLSSVFDATEAIVKAKKKKKVTLAFVHKALESDDSLADLLDQVDMQIAEAAPKPPRKAKKKVLDEDDDEDEEPVNPKKTKKKAKKEEDEPIVEPKTVEDHNKDEEPVKPKKAKKKKAKKEKVMEVEDHDEDEPIVKPKKAKKKKAKKEKVMEVEDHDEDEPIVKPKKAKKKKAKKEKVVEDEDEPIIESKQLEEDQSPIRAGMKRSAESESDEAPSAKKPKLEEGSKKDVSDDFLDFFD